MSRHTNDNRSRGEFPQVQLPEDLELVVMRLTEQYGCSVNSWERFMLLRAHERLAASRRRAVDPRQ